MSNEQPAKPDNAIAVVSSDDADSAYATVQWLLNPLPGGSLLFERPDPRIAALERDLAAAQAEVERLNKWAADYHNEVRGWYLKAEAEAAALRDAIKDIGDFAHDRSTGPAVPDVLWEIRRMAYTELMGEHGKESGNG